MSENEIGFERKNQGREIFFPDILLVRMEIKSNIKVIVTSTSVAIGRSSSMKLMKSYRVTPKNRTNVLFNKTFK